MNTYFEQSTGKWVCRMNVRGQVEEFVAARRIDAIALGVRFARGHWEGMA